MTGTRRSLVVGNIVTMDPDRPRAEAMAIIDGRIAAVGALQEVRDAAGGRAEEHRFAAGAIIPGLIDTHNHMLSTAMQRRLVDISGARSIAELLDAIRAYAAAHPNEPWIVSGTGWHLHSLAERRDPTRQELDEAGGGRPVYLPRGGHAAAVNSRALEIAGVDRRTPEPTGGRIVRNQRGEPTGVLFEPPAFELVGRHVPPPTQAMRRAALRDIQRDYHAAGLCGIVDPGLSSEEIGIYQDLWRDGTLSMRSVVMPLAQLADDPERMIDRLGAWGVRTGFGDARLKLGGIKVFIDGGASLGTALMREPFPDERCNCGIQVTGTDAFRRLVAFCAANDWSLGVHTVGGRAIDIALAVFAEVDASHPLRDRRFHLIHAYLWPSAENIATARRLGIAVATQASMQYRFAPLLVQRFGAEAMGRATPIRSWLDGGVIVGGGSDSPITPYPPLLGIWHAVTRFVDELSIQVGGEQAVTAEEALALYTRNAAWMAFSEHERGMLRPGLLGDWVALDVDPLACPPDRIRDARVIATSVAGELVHHA